MLAERETKKRRPGDNRSTGRKTKGGDGTERVQKKALEMKKDRYKERKGGQKEKRRAVDWLFVDLWQHGVCPGLLEAAQFSASPTEHGK